MCAFTHFGDTWEPVSHIWPLRKLTEFLKGFSVSVNLEYPIWLVRDAIARQCCSRKVLERVGVFRKTVRIDALAIPEVGRGVLDYYRRLVSPALPLDTSVPLDTTVEFSELDQQSEAVAFHEY